MRFSSARTADILVRSNESKRCRFRNPSAVFRLGIAADKNVRGLLRRSSAALQTESLRYNRVKLCVTSGRLRRTFQAELLGQ